MSERQRRYSARSARKVPADQEQERRALLEDALVRSSNFAPAVVAVFDQINPITIPPSFRIKYTRFRGDGSQDVDDWMEQYLATLAANDEGDEDTTKRLFRGLIDGEALRWYNALDARVRADWARLKSAFEQEFRVGCWLYTTPRHVALVCDLFKDLSGVGDERAVVQQQFLHGFSLLLGLESAEKEARGFISLAQPLDSGELA
ncbi:unnamed protein product [Calypogeia fissa]